MNDEVERRDIPVPAQTLEKLGLAAVANLAGGLFLLALTFVGGRFPIAGIVLGALAAIFGFAALFSKDAEDRKPGALLSAGGLLVILSRAGAHFFRPIAGTLLSAGAFGLIAMGIWKGIKFLRGLKSRG